MVQKQEFTTGNAASLDRLGGHKPLQMQSDETYIKRVASRKTCYSWNRKIDFLLISKQFEYTSKSQFFQQEHSFLIFPNVNSVP